MGMETLKNAERAAGFAMASSDDLSSESKSTQTPEVQWRPSEAAVLRRDVEVAVKAAPSVGEWVKGLLGKSGSRAPA